MSRPIKFRAWCRYPDTGWKMVEWHRYFFSDVSVVTGWSGEFLEDDEDVILLQFTGLHDADGKEIYEGDVLTDDDGKAWVVKFGDHVVYEGDYYGEKFTANGWYGHRDEWPDERSLGYLHHDGHVTGNVHENPDLLND